jgi:hypothetical protein
MNLNDNPSLDDLKQLFAGLKDKNHNHILWVCESGAVHVDRLPGGETPEQFEQRHPSLRIRFKTSANRRQRTSTSSGASTLPCKSTGAWPVGSNGRPM